MEARNNEIISTYWAQVFYGFLYDETVQDFKKMTGAPVMSDVYRAKIREYFGAIKTDPAFYASTLNDLCSFFGKTVMISRQECIVMIIDQFIPREFRPETNEQTNQTIFGLIVRIVNRFAIEVNKRYVDDILASKTRTQHLLNAMRDTFNELLTELRQILNMELTTAAAHGAAVPSEMIEEMRRSMTEAVKAHKKMQRRAEGAETALTDARATIKRLERELGTARREIRLLREAAGLAEREAPTRREETSERAAERASERAAERAAEKPTEKPVEKPAEKPTERARPARRPPPVDDDVSSLINSDED